MKITELKCSACNGSLSVEKDNPSIAVCDYCGTKYMLESESSGNVHLGPRTEFITPDYQPRPTPQKNGNPVLAVFASLSAVTVFIVTAVVISIGRSGGDSGGLVTYNQQQETEAEETMKLTGLLAALAEDVIQKPADTITEDDLAKFTGLAVIPSGDIVEVGYSYGTSYTDADGLSWVTYGKEESGTDLDSLPLFTGLKKLETSSGLSSDMLAGLQLESLTCYVKTLDDLAGILEEPAAVRELNITGGLESLDGLDQFPGIVDFTVYCSNISDISNLAVLKNMKSLTINYGDNIEDFSVLFVLTGLESLSVDSEAVKDIGFIRDMPDLVSFSLIDGKILNLDGVAGKESLQSLMIDGCSDLNDSSGVSGLTWLKHLHLELPYTCPDPDLNGLTELETLSITRMDTVKFLRNMTKLESLKLYYCTIDDPSAFAGLESLKSFQCSTPGYDTKWDFVTRIPALEVIRLSSVATYEDISVLFNIPTLRELYLNGMECELNFALLQRNESLETLEMDGVKLYKNVKVSGGGGITYVDYDKVVLDDNTGFLTNYPNLRHLSIADNKLTNIAFASELLYLETVDISSNYVTDIKPLEGLANLTTVSCTGNPVENYRVLSDEVNIVK